MDRWNRVPIKMTSEDQVRSWNCRRARVGRRIVWKLDNTAKASIVLREIEIESRSEAQVELV